MPDPSLAYLGAGFAVAWVVLAAYLLRLWRLQRSIVRRLDEIERRSRSSGTD